MASAYEHPAVVSDYLAEECRKGRVLGPFKHTPVPCLLVSRFSVIPKRGQPNKWRLIVDLSSPEGSSVNDAISADDCSLSYISVDQIAACVLALGRGSLLAKSDVKHSVPAGAGPSSGPYPSRHELEGALLRGRVAPVRSAIGPVDILCPGGRIGVGGAPGRGEIHFHYIDDFTIHNAKRDCCSRLHITSASFSRRTKQRVQQPS